MLWGRCKSVTIWVEAWHYRIQLQWQLPAPNQPPRLTYAIRFDLLAIVASQDTASLMAERRRVGFVVAGGHAAENAFKRRKTS